MIAIPTLVTLALLGATSPTGCPDFGILEQQVDQKLLEMTPSMPLVNVNERAELVMPLEPNEGSGREGFFLVSAASRSGAVSVSLVCRFDAADRLTGCKPDGTRFRVQYITESQLRALKAHEHVAVVEAQLCPAQERFYLPHNRLALRYYLRRPEDPINSTAQVTLTFAAHGALEGSKVVVK